MTIAETSEVAVWKMVGSVSCLLGLKGEQREEIGFGGGHLGLVIDA